MTHKIKSWSKFQHFKDRKPPWIKLYRDILEDPDWHELDGDTAKILVALWLIASEDEDQEGKLPDIRHLAFRLRISEAKANQALTKLSHWLYQDDITMISDKYQCDIPETETETETEIKTEAETKVSRVKRIDNATELLNKFGITGQIAEDFIRHRKTKKAQITETVLSGYKREADKAGITISEAVRISIERNWQGFNSDWIKKEKQELDWDSWDFAEQQSDLPKLRRLT